MNYSGQMGLTKIGVDLGSTPIFTPYDNVEKLFVQPVDPQLP